jgi:hypothetical protein
MNVNILMARKQELSEMWQESTGWAMNIKIMYTRGFHVRVRPTKEQYMSQHLLYFLMYTAIVGIMYCMPVVLLPCNTLRDGKWIIKGIKEF